ncbi:hypothetical protein [Ferruginibacter sp.]
MKIVVNKCFGGFSLSELAVKRMAELNNKPCYFFKSEFKDNKIFHIPIDIKDCEKSLFFSAYTVENPDEYTSNSKNWHTMTDAEKSEQNKKYDEISLSTRPEDRTDKILIQVIEELGKDADGSCASLSIIEIPDDVDWQIDEYDGLESVHEKHRSW